MQLLFSGCYASLALCGNFFNAFTIDYIGRVNALKIGWIGDAVSLIGECIALSIFERTGSQGAAIASVTFLFTHIALFAFNIDVTTYVYTSEIFPNHIRAKGMSASIVAYFASLIIYLEVAPTAFADVSSTRERIGGALHRFLDSHGFRKPLEYSESKMLTCFLHRSDGSFTLFSSLH